MKKGSVRPRGAPLKLLLAALSDEASAPWIERLERAGRPCAAARAAGRDDFAARAALLPYDAVLYDAALDAPARLPLAEALAVLEARVPGGAPPLVVLADPDPGADGGARAGAAALDAGAADWVEKDGPGLDRLPLALARALRLGRLRDEARGAAERSRQAEEKLRAVLDQSPDVVLVLQGATGTVLRANRAAFLLLGRDERELAGKHFSLLLPPGADAAGLLARLRAGALKPALEGPPLLVSQPFRDAAGHDVPMDVAAAPLPWGASRALLCTLRDVAARDEAEAGRLRAEAALERTGIAAIWTGPDGRVAAASALACLRLGRPPGGLDGLALADVEPGLGPELWALHWDELRHYGAFRAGLELRRADGTRLAAEAEVSLVVHRGREWRCALFLDPAPDPGAGPAPDPRLALLRQAPDVVARLDARGAVVELLGAAALLGDGAPPGGSHVRGAPLSAWSHPDDAPAVEAALERARREPLRPARVIWRARRPGPVPGALVLETLVVNRLADPEVRGFVAASRDVTDRHLAEESLLRREDELRQANDELRRAARLRDEFLAGLGHELRTPLNAVLGLAEALRDGHGASAPLSPQQVASLETIRGGGRHLLALLGDLLDLARIEAGRLGLERGPVDAAAAAREALALVGEAARRKDVALSLSDSEPGLVFRADPRRLRQILLNLLANAVAFTPEGGAGAVRLEVERDAARGAVLFHVVDNGIGIDPADLPRLFRPFVQLAGGAALARKQAGPGFGSGLGLSLASRLVRLHGGAIEVESAPGRGSRFTVLLPEHAPDDGPGAADPAAPILPGGARPLLLAGDDEGDGCALADTLAGAGFRVAAARGGLETVEQARALRPDLVVLDTRLDERGGLGGPEVIRRLRAADPAVPIVALASVSVPGDREACLAAGAALYLRRPLAPGRLAGIVAGLLRSPPAPSATSAPAPAPPPRAGADAPAR